MRRVLLLGDSIRAGYQPLVAALLAGRAEVIGPAQNGGDTRRTLENLPAWLAGVNPDVIHVNCGLHDLRVMLPDGSYQVPVEEYRTNVALILARLREAAPKARIIWATTTPVVDERFAGRTDFIRREEDVQRYNAAAVETARAAGAAVEINDLHAVIERAGRLAAVDQDGTHLTDLGYTALAEAVVRFIMKER